MNVESENILSAEEVTVERKKYHFDKRYLSDPLYFGSCRLFQIGRLWCTEDTVVDKHAHFDWFELTIVTDGLGTVYTNDVPTPVRKGDIYLSFPCDFHAITPDPSAPLKYDFFAFGTDDRGLSSDLERIMELYMSPDRRVIRDGEVSSLVSSAIGEIDGDGLYSDRLLESIFTQIIIRVLRAFLHDTDSERNKMSDTETLCYRLMQYIDTHIYSMQSLEELSEETNYNYSYLSALFHKSTGGTLTEYYRCRRLEAARLLLIEGELSITHIAEILNYSSIYTFSRAFKDKYGVSPAQYRKEK